MYTVHFYAGTHGKWLRDRTDEAIKSGIPVFISESAEWKLPEMENLIILNGRAILAG
jgi:hypothetical protein